ncbi:MAG: outer membrane beta-barrel protein [Candidatus Eisenbacteria bacterium]|nr:outer membrane beta-barrel protein [Candidatus Eisenbacteria bacterium]
MVRFPVDSSRRPLFRRSCFLGAFVAALGLTSALAAAGEPHPFELTAFGGYRAGGRFEVEGGRLVLAEGVSFGASLGYHASPDMIVDFTYTRQSTDLEFRPSASGQALPVSNILIQGFYLGGLYEHGLDGSRPFVGIGLGANRLDPEVAAVDSQTRFSFNLSGGLRTDISRQVGLKFTVRGTFSTPPDDGSTIVCQTPEFCYVQAGNSLVSQFDFSVGLAIRP